MNRLALIALLVLAGCATHPWCKQPITGGAVFTIQPPGGNPPAYFDHMTMTPEYGPRADPELTPNRPSNVPGGLGWHRTPDGCNWESDDGALQTLAACMKSAR